MTAIAKPFIAPVTASVGMNEVVSVFVAKYETALIEKRDRLQQLVKSLKSQLAALDKALIDGVNKAAYEVNVPTLNVKVEVESVTVNWTKEQAKSFVSVNTKLKDNDKGEDRYGYGFQKSFKINVNSIDFDDKVRLDGELEAANTELLAAIGQLKDVGRKERQVRATIAEQQLEQAGMSDLLGNTDLQKLIAVN